MVATGDKQLSDVALLLREAAIASRTLRATASSLTRLEVLERCARSLSPTALRADQALAGTSSCQLSHSAVLELLPRLIAPAWPPKELFSDIGGNPAAPVEERSQDAAEHYQATASYLGLLDSLVSQSGAAATLATAVTSPAPEATEQPAAKALPKSTPPSTGRVHIKEFSDESAQQAQQQQAQEAEGARLKQLAVDMMLLAATYCADCRLDAPWTSPAVSAVATSLLHTLALAAPASQPSPSASLRQPVTRGASQLGTSATVSRSLTSTSSRASNPSASNPAPAPAPKQRPLSQVLHGQPPVKRPLIEELEDSSSSGSNPNLDALPHASTSQHAPTQQPQVPRKRLLIEELDSPRASGAPGGNDPTSSPHGADQTQPTPHQQPAGLPAQQQPAQQPGQTPRTQQQASTGCMEERLPDFVVAVLPNVVARLRAAVLAKGYVDIEPKFKPYTGPDTFERALAMRQLGWLLRQLDYRRLSAAIPRVLVLVLAATDDVSPPVQNLALWTLHLMATEGLSSDLRWQRDLLLDVAKRRVSGCDERVWPAAAATAVAVVMALEGKDSYAAGYDMLMQGMLTEGERHAHAPARRTVWLEAALPLLKAVGLANVRYFARLLPLLLQWLHEFDQPTCTGALRSLHAVIQQTWPRIPAHAALLWEHLQAAYQRERHVPESLEQRSAVEWIERCAVLLWWCSREHAKRQLELDQAREDSLLQVAQRMALETSVLVT